MGLAARLREKWVAGGEDKVLYFSLSELGQKALHFGTTVLRPGLKECTMRSA